MVMLHLLLWIEVGVTAGTLLLAYLAMNDQAWLKTVQVVDNFLGVTALIGLGITLLPGISRRLQTALWVQRYVMPLRRHLGILMYLLALSHAILAIFLPNWVAGRLLPRSIPAYVLMGMTALFLTTPLFLTANDWAVRRLGRRWGTLHKLVYVVVLFVFLHVAILGSKWSIFAGGLLGLEIASWAAVWWRNRHPADRVG